MGGDFRARQAHRRRLSVLNQQLTVLKTQEARDITELSQERKGSFGAIAATARPSHADRRGTGRRIRATETRTLTDYGIDVSHVHANGITFAWCKATEGTEGTDYVDPTFASKVTQLRAAGTSATWPRQPAASRAARSCR